MCRPCLVSFCLDAVYTLAHFTPCKENVPSASAPAAHPPFRTLLIAPGKQHCLPYPVFCQVKTQPQNHEFSYLQKHWLYTSFQDICFEKFPILFEHLPN